MERSLNFCCRNRGVAVLSKLLEKLGPPSEENGSPLDLDWYFATVPCSVVDLRKGDSNRPKLTLPHTLEPRVGGSADVPLLFRQVCDLTTCQGIALPVHGTNGFKKISNFQTTGHYMSTSVQSLALAWSEEGIHVQGKECGKKHHIL